MLPSTPTQPLRTQPPKVDLNIMQAAAPPSPAGMFGVKPTPPLNAVPDMREFGDTKASRQYIYDASLEAAKSIDPIEDDNYSLKLSNVDWADPERFSRKRRKQAVLAGETLSRRMKGTWELYNRRTGELIEKRNQIVGAVPYLSSMGTFVNRGNEYTINHQQRLRAGVFARVKDNGELESHFNILPGKGVSHRYFLDPDKGVFKIKLGQAEMPLLPLLRAMGTTDREIRDAWGDALWQTNCGKDDGAATITKLSKRLLRQKDLEGASEGDTTRKLVERFNSMELDPEVTQRTLGKPYDRVSKEAILAATNKLLRVNRKEVAPDDRDHLAYQQFLGPEDLFAERIKRDHGNIRKQVFRDIVKAGGSLSKMKSGVMTPQMEQVLLGSGLAQALEEINPAEVFDKQTRITRLGEGGIPSIDAIPDEARSVQPSHMGFMDPIRTPESFRVGVDLYMARASRKGRDGRIYTQVRDNAGNLVWKSPQDLSDAAITTPEIAKDPFWQTMARVPVMKAGKLDYVKRDEIEYTLPDFSAAFSPLSNLVPFMSATKPGRVSMGARYITQALPVKNAEAPFVQGGIPGKPGTSYEDEYGKHMGSVKADKGGRVMGYKDGVMQVKYEDGTTDEIELYQHHPFNRKSVSGDTQIYIRRGTRVRTVAIEEYDWQAGDLTLSIDPATKRSAWMEVTGYLKHANDKRLYRVTTDSGREVIVTEDHSLMTIGSDGSLCPIYPLDCVIGRTRLPIAMLPDVGEGLGDHVDTGRLDGLYLAEGHCAEQAGLVCIAVADEVRANKVLRLLKDMAISAYRNGGNVCFTDHTRYERFKTQFGHLSHNKFVPDWVLTAPAKYRRGLIEGYMGGDGCLWDTAGAVQVAAVSVSKRLRDGIISVLSTLGVFCTKFDAPRNHINANWRDGYGLRVIARHLDKIPRWFFYVDRERQFRELLKLKYRSSPFEAVPVPNVAARRVLYAGFTRVPKYVHKTAHGGAVAKHRLAAATGPYGDWGRSDVMWDKVAAIELMQHQEWVYDLSVKDAEAFAVCQGLVVHNTFVHQEPLVQPGDRFEPGQVLVKSNYTDNTGATALGLNMRVAYFPYKGLNFEDAQVISESAAKRLTSEHMYQHELEVSDKHKMGKNAFISLFAGTYDKATLAKLDERGTIKVGETVEYGQPLVLAAKERDRALNKIHKKRQAGYSDDSITWKHHSPGVVTDVVWGKNGPVVLVKSESAAEVGDKLSGRYGDKGVISAIVPDAQMPHDKDGKPYEVLLSPDGVVTRTNPSQNIEAALGKIAALTGKPVKVPDFTDIKDLEDWTEQELKKHGLQSTEEVYWPERNLRVKGVGTGYRFMMKLHHTAESKSQGRDGGSYSMDETPAKGGETGCFVGDTYVMVRDCSASTLDYDGVVADCPVKISELVEGRYSGYVPTVTLPRKRKQPVTHGIELVTDWFKYFVPAEDIVTIELANGEKFSCTKNHVLLLKNHKKVLAGDLKPGDDLLEG